MTETIATDEQSAIIDCGFEDILKINAFAGTGKTWTLVEFAKARKECSILYLAYNKAMADEARVKFEGLQNVHVKTMHGLAYGKVGHRYKDRLAGGNLRAKDLLLFIQGVNSPEDKYYYASILLYLLRDWANSGLTLDQYAMSMRMNESINQFLRDMEINYFLTRMPLAWNMLKVNMAMPYEHDFYLKEFQLSAPVLRYDYILVDEAQDTSGVMTDLVLSQPMAKKVFIGDTHQQIYAWRGAVNSLEQLTGNNVVSLHLTKSFRCPGDVASLADSWLRILGSEKRYSGNAGVSGLHVSKTGRNADHGLPTVIARTNANVFDHAARYMDKKVNFVGGMAGYNFSDILDIQSLRKGRKDLVRNGFIASFEDFDELRMYAENAVEGDLKTRIEIAENHPDAFGIIKSLRDNAVDDREQAEVCLTTAHKCKGLEWDHVLLAGDFFNFQKRILSRVSKGEILVNVSREEINLLYVALTRAKRHLTIPPAYAIGPQHVKVAKDFVILEDVDTFPLRKEDLLRAGDKA